MYLNSLITILYNLKLNFLFLLYKNFYKYYQFHELIYIINIIFNKNNKNLIYNIEMNIL